MLQNKIQSSFQIRCSTTSLSRIEWIYRLTCSINQTQSQEINAAYAKWSLERPSIICAYFLKNAPFLNLNRSKHKCAAWNGTFHKNS